MTLSELSARASALRSLGEDRQAVRFEAEWHKRPALGASCLALALAGAAIASVLRKRLVRAAAALLVTWTLYALLRIGEQAADLGRVPPPLAMWGPVALIAAAAGAALWVSRQTGDTALGEPARPAAP